MNDVPRQTLARIIAQHGRGILDSPKRIEALLRDLCGAHRREINILVGALEERVAADLMRAQQKSVPREVLLAQLTKRLQDHLAYTPEAARWAVDSWAVALGVLSEAEFEARARPRAPIQNEQPLAPPARQKPTSTSNATAQTAKPPIFKKPSPPTVRPPAPAAAPPAVAPVAKTRTPPATISVSHPPPPLPVPSSPRRGWKLRGCLISLVLLVIFIGGAIFVVPAVIALLREEQAQPDINGPRIR